MEIFDHISINLNPEKIGKKLLIKGARDWAQFQTLLETVKPLILPKAAYRVRYVSEKDEDGVIVDGVYFRSRVLRKNLDGVERIFPYVVTIGSDLEERISLSQDLLKKYYLDTIGNIALVETRRYLEAKLRFRFSLEGLSYMSPGSLKDWGIEEQRSLFLVLDGVENSIGVELNDTLIMIPRKSVSGIYFATNITFHNCQLCPRERCGTRKADFNEEMTKKYGIGG